MDVINVCTPGNWDIYDSYGLIACQLARHLTAQGVYVNALGFGNQKMGNQPADVAAIVSRPIKAGLGGLLLGYPTAHHAYPTLAQHGRRIAITMFESSRLPSGWTEALNRCDAVIVPGAFCEDVFLDCGVTAPIHVAPLGVGDVYKPAGRSTGRPFTFLAFLDRGLRKGGLVALQAFQVAFGDDPDYRLILKSRKPRQPAEILNPNVTLIQRDMTEQELYELYLEADCMVCPCRGEGFGLLPREFCATGGISLATNWGGTADDIDAWGWPLPYRLVKADWKGHKTLGGQELGEWAEVSIGDCAEAMLKAAKKRDMYGQIAMMSAPVVRQKYDWRRFAEEVYRVWRGDHGVDRGQPKSSRQVESRHEHHNYQPAR